MENMQGIDVKRVCWDMSIAELRHIIQRINRSASKERRLKITGNKGELLQRVWDFFGIPHQLPAVRQPNTVAKKKAIIDNTWDEVQALNLRQKYEEWKKVDVGQRIVQKYNKHKQWDIWSDTDCECSSCKHILQHPKLPQITTIPQAIAQVADGVIDKFRKLYMRTMHWKKLKSSINKREVCILD